MANYRERVFRSTLLGPMSAMRTRYPFFCVLVSVFASCHQPDVPVSDTTPPLLVLGWEDGAHVRHSVHQMGEPFPLLAPVVYSQDSIYHFSLFGSDQLMYGIEMEVPEEWEVVASSVSTNGIFDVDPYRDSYHMKRMFVRTEENLTGLYLELDMKATATVLERPTLVFTSRSWASDPVRRPGTGVTLPVTVQRTPF